MCEASTIAETECEPPPRRKGDFPCFAAVWLPYALLTWRFQFVTDDAFITFRYARNWAAGLGIRYNLGVDPPVEGYSTFLWTAFCALLERIGAPPATWTQVVSFICGSACLWLVFFFMRRRLELGLLPATMGVLCLAVLPPFSVWSTSGMEVMPYTLLLLVAYERLLGSANKMHGLSGGVAGVLVSLIRIEGIAWAFALAVLGLLKVRRERGRWMTGQLATYMGIVAVGFGVYFAWRYWYYGQLLPNTAYCKVSGTALALRRGAFYSIWFYLTFVWPIVALLGGGLVWWFAERRWHAAAAAIMCAGCTAYAIFSGGDFMCMSRFFVPALPFFAFLLGWLLDRIPGRPLIRNGAVVVAGLFCALAGFLPAVQRHVVPESLRAKFYFRWNNSEVDSEFDQWRSQDDNSQIWTIIGKVLKLHSQPGDAVVRNAIGAIGYYSDLFVYDSLGLVTPEVSHRPVSGEMRSPGHDKKVDSTFFLNQRPTFMLATIASAAQIRMAIRKPPPPGYTYQAYGIPPEHNIKQEFKVLVLERKDHIRSGENVTQQ